MSAIELNLRAVAHLQQSEHEDAIKSLRKAMKIIAQTLQDQDCCLDDALDCAGWSCSSRIYSVPVYDVGEQESATCPDNPFTVFNRAFVLPLDEEGMDLSLAAEFQLLTIIFFNTGLVFHQRAIQTGCRRFFDRALQWYDHTMSSLEESQWSSGSVSQLLRLALINNMGHIYTYFFQRDESKCCGEKICDLLTGGSLDILALAPEYFSFFYLNGFTLLRSTEVPAPAA